MSKGIISATVLTILLMIIGCATVERHPDIPANAMLGAEGSERLSYSVPENGQAYVYDATREQMVYAGRVQKGETVIVDTERGRITVDGRPVAEEALYSGNQHRLFFLEEGDVQRRTIETQEIRVEETR
ncbi:hypothetical protein ACERK3_02400 [Phycisphaerales bacterium AB-hyl4]|uniref:Uncharacterized protein n=1 Tax=Natronomicrosphaera hydrolytica TaxID=3242702 RepID=A0ABV4U0L3_9BACT